MNVKKASVNCQLLIVDWEFAQRQSVFLYSATVFAFFTSKPDFVLSRSLIFFLSLSLALSFACELMGCYSVSVSLTRSLARALSHL
jgi:hypothetical protein